MSISNRIPGTCDTHIHLFSALYPAPASAPYRPDVQEIDVYNEVCDDLGIERAVFVQSIVYGSDNTSLLGAMDRFGATRSRGIAIIGQQTSGAELRALDRRGVRGARFFMLDGGDLSRQDLDSIVDMISDLGWHVQLQLNGHALPDYEEQVRSWLDRIDVVIDHIGKFEPPVSTDSAEFQALLRLLDTGRVWVKLSAPYESSSDHFRYADVDAAACRLVQHAPERMLWATNWPHPNTPKQDERALFEQFKSWVPDDRMRTTILADNPARLYRFPRTPETFQ